MQGDDNPYQTMSIATPGPATLPRSDGKRFAMKQTNDISDIDGAHAAPSYRLYTNKPVFTQADIPGSTSKVLCHGRNTRDNSLYIDDIEGTRRMIKDRMMRTNRHVNPLEPVYQLPSYAPLEASQPTFLRDNIDVSDIEGTKPKPKKEFATRDIMSIQDIEGARTGLKQTLKLNAIETKNILDVQDISAKQRYVDRTSRVTDPNAPQYLVNGMEIRDDPLSKPKPQPKQINNFLLQTKDISGAEAGSRYASPFPRKEVRHINYLGDIEGAHADSIKHSIITQRCTNPLQPVYQALDPGEVLPPVVAPLVPPDIIKIPTVPARVRAKPGSTQAQAGGNSIFPQSSTGIASRSESWHNQHNQQEDRTPTSSSNNNNQQQQLTSSRQNSGGALAASTAMASAGANSLRLPLSSRTEGSGGGGGGMDYTSYSNANFNFAPYNAGMTSARSNGAGGGSTPGSGRLSRRAQAALEADVALVRGLQ
eukprot:gene2693-2943_t